ncbi:DUF6314 family protein [Tropicimonas isoalkanivorans]|uniref:DUF6314 domain-containing protein n=1 Tax=Tropicimonas isoalkanivorans TaxID=441112 RepID=A0A1I1DPH8_9RHOB|nr:DUF6314 family protein [Tropicimonas isoalkanivorans]SFB76312.1 hypothetical protein SAMN04488094_101362 [Tropicimonas isoalkanivorans]
MAERPDVNLDSFEGLWRLERRIDDARSGHVLRLEGTATFSRAGEGLILEEKGTLIRPGSPPMTATRRYLWQADGAQIAVLFDDGRPFHRFHPSDAPKATHWCAPDDYRVHYDFTAWPTWSSLWRVDGPRKNYVMQSWYHPA